MMDRHSSTVSGWATLNFPKTYFTLRNFFVLWLNIAFVDTVIARENLWIITQLSSPFSNPFFTARVIVLRFTVEVLIHFNDFNCDIFYLRRRHIRIIIIIIIIIIIFIYYNWVVTRWQWLFYMYTKYEIVYY